MTLRQWVDSRQLEEGVDEIVSIRAQDGRRSGVCSCDDVTQDLQDIAQDILAPDRVVIYPVTCCVNRRTLV